MKLPKYEGSDVQDASAQFSALMKEAEAMVASSQVRAAPAAVGRQPARASPSAALRVVSARCRGAWRRNHNQPQSGSRC